MFFNKQYTFALLCLLMATAIFAQQPVVPAVHANLRYDDAGRLVMEKDGRLIPAVTPTAPYTYEQVFGSPQGTADGIAFDFKMPNLNGTLYYGFIPYADMKHPHPVYLGRSLPIDEGKASLNVRANLGGRYDMVGWEKSSFGTVGYRVANERGDLLYDGILSFKAGDAFEVIPTLIEGPFINILEADGAVISFTTNLPVQATVLVGGRAFADKAATTQHEIKVTGLQPNTNYDYTVRYGDLSQNYSFKTALKPGAKTAFTFAYASDSRNGAGGGERNVHGANFYIMKKIAALAHQQNAAFLQITGDLINGYLTHRGQMDLQYANWKRSVQPWGHHFPIIATMGNHEAFMHVFRDTVENRTYTIDRFPFATESAEKVFADHFVNPLNGPKSEDGSKYDPNPNEMDFPSYEENVFYYTYGNVAMVVLNSDYWYAPSLSQSDHIGGNLHGYIMDNQMVWLEETIAKLEKDRSVQHIFLTLHTPFFPNGGHVGDDMWYRGSNRFRPNVAGQPVDVGIIERRDQLLDILINRSKKTVAILTGDEHNYNKLELRPETNTYPDDWDKPKLQRSRTIWQINNGAAGAPYYAQEQTPWTPWVTGFTTQNALVFFDVKKKRIRMRVVNPDTLEEFDTLQLR